MVSTIVKVLIAVAIYLLIVSGRVMSLMGKTNAADSTVMRATQGIYTIGIIALTAGAVLLITDYKSDGNSSDKNARLIMQGLIGALALTLLVLSAVVVNKSSGEARNWAISLLVASLLLLVAVVGVVVYEKKTKKVLPIKLGMDSDTDTSDSEDSDTTDSEDDSDNFQFACY
jgi:cell division protein FtsW (lipid II flippase)